MKNLGCGSDEGNRLTGNLSVRLVPQWAKNCSAYSDDWLAVSSELRSSTRSSASLTTMSSLFPLGAVCKVGNS